MGIQNTFPIQIPCPTITTTLHPSAPPSQKVTRGIDERHPGSPNFQETLPDLDFALSCRLSGTGGTWPVCRNLDPPSTKKASWQAKQAAALTFSPLSIVFPLPAAYAHQTRSRPPTFFINSVALLPAFLTRLPQHRHQRSKKRSELNFLRSRLTPT
jgi:hypothetical protein